MLEAISAFTDLHLCHHYSTTKTQMQLIKLWKWSVMVNCSACLAVRPQAGEGCQVRHLHHAHPALLSSLGLPEVVKLLGQLHRVQLPLLASPIHRTH